MTDKTEKLESFPEYRDEQGVDYVSDTKNWVFIHVTRYEPKKNKDGELALETTAMATGYKLPRATVHGEINGIVCTNSGGCWDNASFAVIASYNQLVEKNGQPLEVAAEDTYFAPNPDTGLVLPDDVRIVRPDPNCEDLFVIDEHGARYKSDNYTDKEIQKILDFADPFDKEKYEMYLSGNVPEYKLGYDKRVKALYESAKDKKAFMRGLFEEDRYVILNHLLRDYVTQLVTEKMGYHFVYAHENDVSQKIADVAEEAGLNGDCGNKGHSNSVECQFDMHGYRLSCLVDVLKSKNVDSIYEYLTEYSKPFTNEVIAHILSDRPLPDIYKSFEDIFNQYAKRYKERYKDTINSGDYLPDKVKIAWENNISHLDNGLKAYSPHLDTTLRRHSKRMQLECNQALKELRQDTKMFTELKQRLKEHVQQKENENLRNFIMGSGKGGISIL